MRLLLSLLFLLMVLALGVALSVYAVPQIQDSLFERIARRAMASNHSELLKDDALRAFVCGSASPFADPGRAKACIGVIAGGKIYFVDTGPQSYARTAEMRIPIGEIGGVFLTHLHSDHIADLGEFNMNSWILGRRKPLDVYGPVGVDRVVAGYSEAYALDRGYRHAHHGYGVAPLEIWPMIAKPVVMPGDSLARHDRSMVIFEDGALKVTAFEVNHEPVAPALGYRFDYKGRSVVISGDTAKHLPLIAVAKNADVLFHEAQANHMVKKLQALAQEAKNERLSKILLDIQDYHTSPVEAADLANKSGVKLLVFYHLVPGVPNAIAGLIFGRDVASIRPSGWEIAQDGLLIEMPFASEEVRQSRIE